MRCNPLRWWWGLLPVAALVWLAFIWEREPIQQDLRDRTEQALAAAGLHWAGTAFDGRDGLLKGLAFNDEHPGQAADVVRKVWGVRDIQEKVDLIDFVDSYAWSAEAIGKTILLTGYVPNEETRLKLRGLVEARFPGFQIDDRTTLARGAPSLPAWTGAIGFGLDRLAQLKSGILKLNGLGLSIAGEAVDFGTYKSALAALRSASPEGVTIEKNDIRPPIVSPYTWGATRSPTHLIMSGHVPGEEQRERIFALAKKAHPSVVIIDRMETGAGAPTGWETAVESVVAQIARLEAGEGKLSDKQLTLNGKALDEDTANAVTTEIGDAIPKGFSFRHEVAFPEPKPPLVSPYVTSFEATADRIRLTGFVPDEAARASLLEAASTAFPGKAVDDAMALGSGQPEGWQRCLLAGIEATSKLGSGNVLMSDKTLKVTAKTSNEELAAAMPGDVRAATNRSCDSEVVLTLDLPTEPDLSWRAVYDGNNTLALDGEVPDIETLTLLLSAARKQFPKADIDNRMKIAGGYAAKWQKAAAHGITLLRLLRRGEANLTGQALVITGEAADTAAATAIKDRLTHNLPKNYFGRDVVEVKSDAMIWAEVEAKRKAEEAAAARIRADEEANARRKAADEAAARRAVDEAAQRRTREEAAARSKADEDAAARRKLEEILALREADRKAAARVQAGAATAGQRAEVGAARRKADEDAASRRRLDEIFAQRKAEAARRAADAQAQRQAEREAAARRKSEEEAARRRKADEEANAQRAAQVVAARQKQQDEARRQTEAEAEAEAEANLRKAEEKSSKEQASIARDRRTATPERRPVPAAAVNCQKRLSDALSTGLILFDYASAELSSVSRPTLDELAKIANNCPDVNLAVEGHTDSVGQRPANHQLSLRRSEAVIDYLVSAGVPRSRLRPVGYGEEHPVEPNNSSSNRARNRRIEFSIDPEG
ncbi:MAG: OmpA family protein [Alphaproteobacteria bacterium]|nr:OmpA family protein [Alphaproteobacteria bacterium]